MKRTAIISAIAAAVLGAWAPPGAPQGARPYLIAGGVGYANLSDLTITAINGEEKDSDNPTPDGSIAVGGGVFYMATPGLGVGAEVSWLDFGTQEPSPGTEDSYSALPFTGQAIYMAPTNSRVSTFATGGLGLYHLMNEEKGTETIESTSNVFGLNVGGGIKYDTGSSLSFGVDLRFHMAFNPDLKGDTDLGERSVETSDWKMFAVMGKVFF